MEVARSVPAAPWARRQRSPTESAVRCGDRYGASHGCWQPVEERAFLSRQQPRLNWRSARERLNPRVPAHQERHRPALLRVVGVDAAGDVVEDGRHLTQPVSVDVADADAELSKPDAAAENDEGLHPPRPSPSARARARTNAAAGGAWILDVPIVGLREAAAASSGRAQAFEGRTPQGAGRAQVHDEHTGGLDGRRAGAGGDCEAGRQDPLRRSWVAWPSRPGRHSRASSSSASRRRSRTAPATASSARTARTSLTSARTLQRWEPGARDLRPSCGDALALTTALPLSVL